MSAVLAAAAANREASPIALVVILLLVVALVVLVRSMNRHLRKVPGSFAGAKTPPVDRDDPEDRKDQ